MNTLDLDNTDILKIAQLRGVPPRQTLSLSPAIISPLVQAQKLNTLTAAAVPPVINVAAPLNIRRQLIGPGQYRVSVQFLADPSNQTYANTSIFLRNIYGTQALQASSANGPIIFNTTTPAAQLTKGNITVQSSNSSGVTSNTRSGSGTGSNKINVL